MKFKSTLTIALAFLFLGGTTLALAHKAHFTKSARSPQNSYDFRVSAMTIYKWNLSPMGAMLKGKMKFDAKAFAESAEGLKMASSIKLLQGFPSKSSENELDDSNAKPAIWKNFEDFEAKFKNFQIEANALAEVAKKGNQNAIKAQFKKTNSSCSACHKKYKTK